MKHLVAILISVYSSAGFAQDLEDNPASLTPEIENVDVPKADLPKKKRSAKNDPADVSKEEAGDTYNFYFQKGSGPGSVEQGGGAQKAKPEGTSTTPKVEADDEVSMFEGHLGLIVMPGSSGSGLSIGGQFNASKKFGLQVHFLSLQGEAGGGKSSSFSASGTEDKETKLSSSGGSVAGVYTPVTLNQANFPVRIGVVGGLMLLSTTREETTSTFSARGSFDDTQTSKSSKALPFVGLSATAKLGEQFGVVGYGKLASDSDYSQIGLSGAWFF